MDPLVMILSALGAVAVMAVWFTIEQRLARRRAKRRVLPPLCSRDTHAEGKTATSPNHGWDEFVR